MRKICMLIFSLICLLFTKGQSQGVIALTTLGGQTQIYNQLDSALFHASDGDYIYLPGGVFNISNPIKKRIKLIGTGHYPDSTIYTDRSIIQGNVILGAGASNALIEGLYVTGDIHFTPAERTDHVVIRRCNFNNLAIGNFWGRNDTARIYQPYILHNVIRGNIDFPEAYGFIVQGNIIAGAARVCIYHGGFMENNIFLSVGNLATLSDLRNITFKNNIFMNTLSLGYQAYASYGYDGTGGTFGCTFLNNIFVGKDSTINILPMASVNLNNKFQVNANNLFTSQNGTLFDYTANYQITANSPAKNAGNDGTDAGIFGSANPYKEGGVPVNPHISFKNIAPSTLPNGHIQIQIKVSAQDR